MFWYGCVVGLRKVVDMLSYKISRLHDIFERLKF